MTLGTEYANATIAGLQGVEVMGVVSDVVQIGLHFLESILGLLDKLNI